MNQRLLALFVLLCAVLSVIAAPVDGNILEARALKKTVAKPVAKPVVKPVAKPAKPVAVAKPPVVAAKPPAVAAKPPVVATKPPVVAAKPPVVAAKPPVVAAKPSVVAAKPPVVAAKPPTVAAKPPTAPPPASCPLPARSPTRRFLEYLGLRSRSSSASCPPLTGSTSTASTPTTPLDPATSKAAAKAAAKAAKAAAAAAKVSAKAAAAAAASASAAALKRPTTGVVSNPPTNSVQCTNSAGALTAIPLASIQQAVTLAQAGPLVGGKNPAKFPHVFNNREGVKVAAACAGKTLEEQAVGVDMSTFQNVPSVLSTPAFNQFRVLITTPDATGATTFCGVMTHGTSTTGTFDKDLCAEV
ncbi:hypothetical protein C8R44DRAFT_817904 [Mycena epipterygia]|nr:hypothetical protein C8R44DRAFT_817904 [Mycena epipterygia]